MPIRRRCRPRGSCTLLLDEPSLYVCRTDACRSCWTDTARRRARPGRRRARRGRRSQRARHVLCHAGGVRAPSRGHRGPACADCDAAGQAAARRAAAPARAPGGERCGYQPAAGPYAPRSSLGVKMREWRLPAALAAATALLFVTVQAVSFWQLNRREALDAQMPSLRQALPGSPSSMPGHRCRERWLPAAQRVPACCPSCRCWRKRSRRLRARGSSDELPRQRARAAAHCADGRILDGIKQAMSRDGISVNCSPRQPRGGVVEGRFQVRVGQA